jgi:hypothetical protein
MAAPIQDAARRVKMSDKGHSGRSRLSASARRSYSYGGRFHALHYGDVYSHKQQKNDCESDFLLT